MSTSLQTLVQNAAANIISKLSEIPYEPCCELDNLEHQISIHHQAVTHFAAECHRLQCGVKERRNALIPFHVLPVELCGDILLASMGKDWLGDLRRLLSVSRYWRKIIDSSPRFWAAIDASYKPNIITTFLRRSKSALLSIDFTLYSNSRDGLFDSFMTEILPYINRFRALKVAPWFPTPVGDQLLRSSLPVLEELTISGQEGASSFPLPVTPSLRSLALRRVHLDRGLPTVPNLRHLNMSHIKSPPSPADLLNMFNNVPLLESLELSDWEAQRTAGAESSPTMALSTSRRDAVELSKLQSLSIRNVPPHIAQVIMSGLKTSKYTHFHVDDVDPDHLDSCVAHLASLLKALQSVRLRMSASEAIAFDILDGDLNGGALSIGIKTTPTNAIHHLEQILRVLSQASPMTPLDVKLGWIYRRDKWESLKPSWNLKLSESVFEACAGLRALWVGQCIDIDSVLDILATPKEDAMGIRAWPCPNISRLYLPGWHGDVPKLSRLAQARWEVPGRTPCVDGLQRRRLSHFQPPGSKSFYDVFKACVRGVMQGCYEQEVEPDWFPRLVQLRPSDALVTLEPVGGQPYQIYANVRALPQPIIRMKQSLETLIRDAVKAIVANIIEHDQLQASEQSRQVTTELGSRIQNNGAHISARTPNNTAMDKSRAYDRALKLFAKECRRQQCDLRERRNADLPFHRLPPEITSEILLLSLPTPFKIQKFRDLQLVSRSWRKIMRSTPRFWTHIASNHPIDVVSRFLRKSKSAPLDVICTESDSVLFDDFIKVISSHSHRFRTLDLFFHPTPPGLQILQSTLPSLQELRLVFSDVPPSVSHLFPIHLPTMPTLQRLSLACSPWDWKPIRLTTLRHLGIDEIDSPSPRELIAVLSELTGLESLEISEWTSTSGPMSIEEAKEMAHLPRLESVRVDNVPHAISRAVTSFVVATEFKRFSMDGFSLNHLGGCLPALKPLIESSGSIHVIQGGDSVEMKIYINHPYEHQRRAEHLNLDVSISSSPREIMRDLQDTLRMLSRCAPSTSISLQLGALEKTQPICTLHLTGAVLENCPNLQVLWVGREVDMGSALEWLSRPKQDETGKWSWPCPLLSEMFLREWDSKGDLERFCHLARTRWEVPGTLPGIPGLPRERLWMFQPPEGAQEGDPFATTIMEVMEDCCKHIAAPDCPAFE